MPANHRGRQDIHIACLPPQAIDYEAAARLISDAFHIHAIMNGRDRTDAAGLREEIGDTGHLLAIHRDNILVACALIRPASDVARAYETPWLVTHPHALYYGMAAVHPRHMHQRLGAHLLSAAEDHAREHGHTEIVLSALREMGNDAYYLRHGYTTEAVLTYERDGIPSHLHHMVKPLPPRPQPATPPPETLS